MWILNKNIKNQSTKLTNPSKVLFSDIIFKLDFSYSLLAFINLAQDINCKSEYDKSNWICFVFELVSLYYHKSISLKLNILTNLRHQAAFTNLTHALMDYFYYLSDSVYSTQRMKEGKRRFRKQRMRNQLTLLPEDQKTSRLTQNC